MAMKTPKDAPLWSMSLPTVGKKPLPLWPCLERG
mgnify:CR=1 FL=1